MNGSWYKKCMPKVKEALELVASINGDLKELPGVRKIYIWGSLAHHQSEPSYRIKDVDLLIKMSIHSGDLISIDEDVLHSSKSIDELEEDGYDRTAISLSRHLDGIQNNLLDCWGISDDKKLLHWGAMFTDRPESEDIKKEAEEYAETRTGLSARRLQKSSLQIRSNWYTNYRSYMDRHFSDMPTGWYESEETDIKNILTSACEVQ